MIYAHRQDFDNMPETRTSLIISGEIISCVVRRIGRDTNVITEITVDTLTGYRLFTVAVSVGESLYHYINSAGRYNRMKDVKFSFNVKLERQIVTDYTALDKGEFLYKILKCEHVNVMEYV